MVPSAAAPLVLPLFSSVATLFPGMARSIFPSIRTMRPQTILTPPILSSVGVVGLVVGVVGVGRVVLSTVGFPRTEGGGLLLAWCTFGCDGLGTTARWRWLVV